MNRSAQMRHKTIVNLHTELYGVLLSGILGYQFKKS
jgi:hypothetical protein